MKVFWRISLWTLLGVLSLFLLLYTTHYYMAGDGYWFGTELERISYAVWGVTLAVYFFAGSPHIRPLWGRLVTAGTTALLYTLLVLLTNNYWRYLCFLQDLPELEMPYRDVLLADLAYSVGTGAYRYPLLFAGMLVVCAVGTLAVHPPIRSVWKGWLTRLEQWWYRCSLRLGSVEEYYLPVWVEADSRRLIDYVLGMPLNDRSKAEMMACTDEHDDLLLVSLLLRRFGGILTREEYLNTGPGIWSFPAGSLRKERNTTPPPDRPCPSGVRLWTSNLVSLTTTYKDGIYEIRSALRSPWLYR